MKRRTLAQWLAWAANGVVAAAAFYWLMHTRYQTDEGQTIAITMIVLGLINLYALHADGSASLLAAIVRRRRLEEDRRIEALLNEAESDKQTP